MTGLSGSESDVTVILRCLSVERKGFATRLDYRLVHSDRTQFGTDLESSHSGIVRAVMVGDLFYDRIVNSLLEGRIDALHFGVNHVATRNNRNREHQS